MPDTSTTGRAQARNRKPKKPATKSKATAFTHTKFCWIEQVAREQTTLPDYTTAVAVEVLHSFEMKHGGAAIVYQETIATALGVRRATVNVCIKALVESGNLTSKRRGRDQPNAYEMVIKPKVKTAETEAARSTRTRTSSTPNFTPDDVRVEPLRSTRTRTDSSSPLQKEKEGESNAHSRVDFPPASAPSGAREVELLEGEALPPISATALGRAFNELRSVIWDRGHAKDRDPDHIDCCRKLFVAACLGGADLMDVVAAARVHAAAADAGDGLEFLPPLDVWLRGEGWKHPPRKRPPRRGDRRSETISMEDQLTAIIGGLQS